MHIDAPGVYVVGLLVVGAGALLVARKWPGWAKFVLTTLALIVYTTAGYLAGAIR